MEVKFSIPPYVSLLARSVATLEGVALQGDPGYLGASAGEVMQLGLPIAYKVGPIVLFY